MSCKHQVARLTRACGSIVWLLFGCAIFVDDVDISDNCYDNRLQNVTNFEVITDAVTPSGIHVDTGGHDVDLLVLDVRIARMAVCLDEIMDGLTISEDSMRELQCLRRKFVAAPLKRHCLAVKIVDPVFDACSDWSFIGVDADPALCAAKGIEPGCQCKWRTAVQDENVIVTPPLDTRRGVEQTTPPAPYLWELVRIVTSCNNWAQSPFAICANF